MNRGRYCSPQKLQRMPMCTNGRCRKEEVVGGQTRVISAGLSSSLLLSSLELSDSRSMSLEYAPASEPQVDAGLSAALKP